jgi:hypothetical protein
MRESQKGCIEAEFSSCAGWWLWGLVQGKAGFNSPPSPSARRVGYPGFWVWDRRAVVLSIPTYIDFPSGPPVCTVSPLQNGDLGTRHARPLSDGGLVGGWEGGWGRVGAGGGGGVGLGGEAGGGEGVGVVLLDEGDHLFADDAAEIEVLAGVAGADQAAQLHGAIGQVGDLESADLLVPEGRGVDDGVELVAEGFDGDGVVDVEEGGAHDVGGLAGPVLEGVFDKKRQWNNQSSQVPDADDDVGGVDLFDAAPLALDDDDVVDADGFGDGDLEAGQEVGGGGFGCGGEDERGDPSGGEQARAVVPDAGIVEAPEEGTSVDDDDEGDGHAAEELELGVDAAGGDVVLGGEIVAAEDGALKDVDAADDEPAERGDHRHDEALADDVFEVVGKIGHGWQDAEQDGEEEDGAGRAAEMLLQSPAEMGGLGLFAADEAEEDVMDEVREDQRPAEEEDGEEPAVAEVKVFSHRQRLGCEWLRLVWHNGVTGDTSSKRQPQVQL